MNLKDAFSHLDENEKVSLVLRKHPVVFWMALKDFMLFSPDFVFGNFIFLGNWNFQKVAGAFSCFGVIYYLFLAFLLSIGWNFIWMCGW